MGIKTFVYKKYTDSGNNVLIAESSVVSDTADLTYVDDTLLTNAVNLYDFKPKLFGKTNNPIRINFKLDTDLTIY